jgi:ferredoxin-fold anticodon binding domain-containing protein
MLKKFVIFIVLSTIYLLSETITASYHVSYGIFGKIGIAKAILEKKGNTYSIDIKLSATGLAKLLSQGRSEQHTSKGHIQNKMLISDSYSVTKSHAKTLMTKIYTFNHKNKSIHKEFKKYKKGKETRHEKSVLDFYSPDDLLTLYFNLENKVPNKLKAHIYEFKTVGAEGQGGKVSIEVPKQRDLEKYKKVLGNDALWYATAIIHQKIFSSKEGRLMLGIDKDGICNQAVLKDVIFFGDIRAIRIK